MIVANYLAPAVYVEEVSFRAPSIEGVGTTTTGFAGPALTGPVGGVPQLLTSFGDFQSMYGGYDQLSLSTNPADPQNTNFLALSVKGFFDNGGSMLYVSRVFAGGSAAAAANCATAGSGDVTLGARFPGAFANNQSVTVNLVATKIPNVSSLPQGSLVASVAAPAPLSGSVGTLKAEVDVTNPATTQITLNAAFTGSVPPTVLVDNETLSVSGIDATKTILTVSPITAKHAQNAPVLAALVLGGAVAASDTTVTISPPLSGATPATVQIDKEILAVSAVDATKTVLTVTRGQGGSNAAPHSAGAAVALSGVTTLYANGTGSTFTSGATPLPATTPAGMTLYALTLQVSAYGAASQKVSAPGGQQLQVYDGLGFDVAHPSYLGTMLGATPPRHIDSLENQVAFNITAGLAPGTLFTNLFGTSASPANGASKTFVLAGGNDGGAPVAEDYDVALALFEGLEDIAIVAAPGSSIFPDSEAIIDSLITHVSRQRAYRVALLDTPPNQIASDNEDVRARIDSSYAAIYTPWVLMSNPLARSGTAIPAEVAVPPSGFMAGIYARNDDQNSVAKAPANEVVLDALDFERQITFAEQATLNPLGINCLRYFPDRGYRVWGARTASSDSEFMYVNVRRYLIYLEHSIDNSTQWAVFENNGPALWARVKDSVDSFLYNEFVEGRLLGASPSQAYFVRCDRSTMTQNDLDNGRMICLIGAALLKPAEFVIFRIGQKTSDARS